MYNDKDYCRHCGATIDLNYKNIAICPTCNAKLEITDIVPGWRMEMNKTRLKAMHDLMCEANAESIYMTWATLGVPDCPSEQDFFEIALDEEECKEIFELFKELISKKGYW